MRYRFTAALVALWLVACVSVAGAAEQRVIVRDVLLDEYPRVKLQLGLPTGDESARTAPEFSVRENGRRADVLDTSQPKAEPIDVILVLDTSGSMQGRSLAAAKQAANAFVDKLEPGSRVGVISFSDQPRVVSPIAAPQPGLKPSIDALSASGETALYDALALSAKEASRAQVRRPLVVLLSDGGDTVSRGQLDTAVKNLKSAGAPVLVVALPSAEADHKTLRSISSQTGGRFASVGGADELVRFYEKLASQLQTTWNLTYVSRRPSTKDLDIAVDASTGGQTATGSVVIPNPLFSEPVENSADLRPAPPASMITLLGAAILVFTAVFALVAALLLLVIKPKTALDQVKYYDQMHASGEAPAAEDEYGGRITSSVLGAVDYVAGKRGVKRYVYEQLERAGLPLRPTEYITIHLLAVIAVGIAGAGALGQPHSQHRRGHRRDHRAACVARSKGSEAARRIRGAAA